ncbi:hypothetical protein FRB90_002093 [Tulasnella sp. 427]|nr:hypothetical protein FRB90_002093 [Tulasnella sp. 427]
MAAQLTDLERGVPFVPDEPLPSPDDRSEALGDELGGLPTEENASTSEDTISSPPPQPPTTNDPKDETPPHPKPSADGAADPNVVTWDGPNDPANPQNWSNDKKWIGSVVESLMLSIFILAYAIGPLFLGPMSEIFGRSSVLQLSNLLFLAFNIGCSRATTVNQMLAFRFLAGLGGSAPLAIGGGTIGDLFTADNRGKALSVYTLAPLTEETGSELATQRLGPALGPVMGGWIAEKASWRWIFYSTSIADAVIQLLGIVFLRETYAPKLLSIKTRQQRAETGNPKLRSMYTKPGHVDVYDATPLQWVAIVAKGAVRPLKMLVTQPIVQVFALYQAVLYGTMYLTLTTFAALWTEEYHYSVGIAGLHYIALGIGFTLGSQFGARGLDIIYRRLKARNGGVGTPEMRMPLMMFMAVLLPVGLVIYGWSAQYHLPWIVPDIGACILTVGIMGNFLPIQSYLVDHYTLHAASAIGATSSFRSLAGFGFPLFANSMFRSLGLGWGNTLLAFVAVAICGPSPYIFYHYGARIRMWSSKRWSAPTPTPKGATGNTKRPGQSPHEKAEAVS